MGTEPNLVAYYPLHSRLHDTRGTAVIGLLRDRVEGRHALRIGDAVVLAVPVASLPWAVSVPAPQLLSLHGAAVVDPDSGALVLVRSQPRIIEEVTGVILRGYRQQAGLDISLYYILDVVEATLDVLYLTAVGFS